jgi:hypothetical protein
MSQRRKLKGGRWKRLEEDACLPACLHCPCMPRLALPARRRRRFLLGLLLPFSTMALGAVWLDVLKFNKHRSTFVLFDKKFSIF